MPSGCSKRCSHKGCVANHATHSGLPAVRLPAGGPDFFQGVKAGRFVRLKSARLPDLMPAAIIGRTRVPPGRGSR